MKHILFIVSLTVVVLLAGCSKELDLYPKDSISDVTFWKSSSDFKLAANNLYNSLGSFDIIMGDVESDIAYNVNNAISNGTYLVTETDANWNTPYGYIRQCNKIIASGANSAVASDAGVIRFAAEAKFFRAWNYWNLFRLYGGVPLIKDVLDITSKELYSKRATRKETVDFILQDLTEAVAGLPLKSALVSSEVGRITKGTALALKARIALFEGTWGKYRGDAGANGYLDIAIEASNSLISSAQYTLYTGSGAKSYWNLFNEKGDDSPESILDNRYELNVREQRLLQLIHDTRGYLATKKMADMYLCNDGLPVKQSPLFQGYATRVSEFQNRDPRMTLTLLTPGSFVVQHLFPTVPIESWPFFPQRNGNTGYITDKFRSEDVYGNTTQKFGFDIHLIRYAEVLLIYAEATFEKNGTISDADLNKSINVIRQRVGMLALTNAFVTSNGLDIKTEIRRERTIELAFENFRYDDLRRWKTAENELPQALLGIKVKGSQWGTDPIIVNGVDKNPYSTPAYQSKTDENGFLVVEPAGGRSFNPAKHYLRPLPSKEILINPDLQQNPGW
ncbi:MAG: RagB/SusD family nutrient uptake outer membrane protein [Bacteroidota bacterium]|nr:RagB/SusD family nutrient uptake outer membrane protein [Bacteroidota bacterium]